MANTKVNNPYNIDSIKNNYISSSDINKDYSDYYVLTIINYPLQHNAVITPSEANLSETIEYLDQIYIYPQVIVDEDKIYIKKETSYIDIFTDGNNYMAYCIDLSISCDDGYGAYIISEEDLSYGRQIFDFYSRDLKNFNLFTSFRFYNNELQPDDPFSVSLRDCKIYICIDQEKERTSTLTTTCKEDAGDTYWYTKGLMDDNGSDVYSTDNFIRGDITISWEKNSSWGNLYHRQGIHASFRAKDSDLICINQTKASMTLNNHTEEGASIGITEYNGQDFEDGNLAVLRQHPWGGYIYNASVGSTLTATAKYSYIDLPDSSDIFN